MNHPLPPSLSMAELSAEAADLLAAAVRNGTPGEGPGLPATTDAADAVAALALVGARLPELLDLLAAFLSSEQAAGRFGPDRAQVLAAPGVQDDLRTARDAREHLYAAARTAAVLAGTLEEAASVLAPFALNRPSGRPPAPHA